MITKKYAMPLVFGVLKKTYVGFLLIGLLCLSACKEECWVCQTECVEFTENYFRVKTVCLSEYVDTLSYQNQVDSFSQLYESGPAQKYGETLCEDRFERLELLQSLFGYRRFEK